MDRNDGIKIYKTSEKICTSNNRAIFKCIHIYLDDLLIPAKHRASISDALAVHSFSDFILGCGDLVVRSELRVWKAPGSKPDPTEFRCVRRPVTC
ncbi:hypothetical protein AVEN_248826-1 [Araneus ventricosus]|uniref:Reverse transcriptase domain-containing protein n=1 Tax=Araneus ventricosus TaxID=182803 RepID=A0A4Y2HXG3_ARAVE|nr:hypothetical protein AVEN_248826-1 [Araneus ventricosus]